MDVFMTGVAVALAAYLAGSVSTAYLLTRMVKGIDIRTVGSRNPGAVNVFRQVGSWAGLSVLGIDAFKGVAVILAVRVTFQCFHDLPSRSESFL